MPMTIGILGAGRIGRIHCDNIANSIVGVKLVAICDPYLDKESISHLGIANCLSDEEAFWQIPFDAVIIASPTTHHRRQVERALSLGRHVFCEKPLDHSLSANLAIKQKLQDTKLHLQMGFNRRFDGDFQKIARVVADGQVGQPYLLNICSRDPSLPPRDYLKNSGGLFLDMSIHDFDMARFITGSEVTEVFARGEALIDPTMSDDIDTAVITLRFANRCMGVIHNSRQAVYGYDQRLELFGSAGSIMNSHHKATNVEQFSMDGQTSEPLLNFFIERYRDSYLREMQSFIDNCSADQKPAPGIDDAIAALKIAMLAKVSLQKNQPVTWEMIDDEALLHV